MSNSDPKSRPRPGPWPPAPDNSAMPPSSWAKRTGFRPKFSGETNASDSGQISLPPRPASREPNAAHPDLEAGRVRQTPTANGQPEKEKEKENAQPAVEKEKALVKRRSGSGHGGANGNAQTQAPAEVPVAQQRRTVRSVEAVDVLPQSGVDDDGVMGRHSHLKYELRDTPGLGKFLSVNV